MFWKFLDDLSFITRCRKYNIGIWQCPNFLFLVMGFLTIAIMFGTYGISQHFYSEAVTIISVSLSAMVILSLGYMVIQGVERVAEANIMKSEFISIISHQLCSPLSVIKWNVEILQTENDKNSEFADKQALFLGNVQKANETMLKLINDLMELIRIDQGKSTFENKPLNLAVLTKEVINALDASKASKQIDIIFDVEENLPWVSADPKKMKTVIENLLGNAIKYSHYGGKVEIKLYSKREKVYIVVKDQGVGIPKYQCDKVFNKFFRSNNSSKYCTDGVGIGLYLTKAILKYFSGKVWFESEEGKGSTFYVSLPRFRNSQFG